MIILFMKIIVVVSYLDIIITFMVQTSRLGLETNNPENGAQILLKLIVLK